MTKNQKIFSGIDALVSARDLNRELVIEGLEESISLTCKKIYDFDQVEVNINYDTKRISINGVKTVVEEVMDPITEISLSAAQEIKKSAKLGEELKIKLKIDKELLERAAVQSAKQTFRQKLKDAEYRRMIEEYGEKVGKLVYGQLEEIKEPNIYFMLGTNALAVLGPKHQIPGEKIEPDQEVPLIIESIRPQSKKGPKIIVSRNNDNLVLELMKKYVPEVASGDIEVAGVARDPGDRSKVAIFQKNMDVDIDIMGCCIGTRGSRINNVKRELNGENIDLIEVFEDDPILNISSALAPALVLAVQIIDEEKKESRVIVPDNQYSLSIGMNGQNARLASKLIGWKIDIKSETDAKSLGIEYEDDII